MDDPTPTPTNHPAPAATAEPATITPAPFSEQDLREAWNSQADRCSQWDELDSWEQLAIAQTRAIAADRTGRPAPAKSAELTDEELLRIYGAAKRDYYYKWNIDDSPMKAELAATAAGLRAAIAADRAMRPAPAAPVDLNALLSPAGAYETGPDAGNADGAQLVRDYLGGNPTWWAPAFGSDSLDNLLSRIQDRILPHLRPPVIGVDVPGPDGDWGNIADLCQAEGVEVQVGARLLRRARAAWAYGQATPSAEEGRQDARATQLQEAWGDMEPTDAVAGLAQLASQLREEPGRPTPPAEGEAGELVAWIHRQAVHGPDADEWRRAAALLQQQAAELAVLRQVRHHA
jgi:hypothetical protein